MVSPADKFKVWYHGSPEVVATLREKAADLFGYSDRVFDEKVRDAIWWLEKNGHLKKVKGRRDHKRFLMNYLKPKDWDNGSINRRSPSKARRPSGRYRM